MIADDMTSLSKCAQTLRVPVWRVVLRNPITGIAGCCARPTSGRAAERRDERAPFHSITSSARTSSDLGMVRPSAFKQTLIGIPSTSA